MRPGSWNIDRSHPLAQGLVRALLFSEKVGGPVDAVTNAIYPLGGAALPTWDYGGMKFNGAVGTTSYVDIADGPVIGANQDLSVFCAIRNAGYANVSQHYGEVIYCERAATGNDIFKVQMGGTISYDRGSRAHFIWRNDAGNLMEVRGGEIADGLPHTIALVVAGTSVKLVTDGTRIDNGTRVVGSFTNANIKSRVCGDAASLPGSNNDGYLDLLLLYNRALSPAEIAILADRTDPMLGGLIVEERPVLYFDMGGAGTDALTANDLVVGGPVLGTPAIGQIHALTAQSLVVGSPVLGAPALGQIHALTAQDLVVGSPVLGSPAIAQIHALTALWLTVGAPVLGAPALGDYSFRPVFGSTLSFTAVRGSRLELIATRAANPQFGRQ